MQAAVGVDDQRQRVEVGLGQLGQLAPALDLGDDLVLGADRLEHAGVGRVAGLAAPLARQAELAEQDLLQLLGRAERELLAGELVDLGLERVGLGLDPLGDLVQALGVELDPGELHVAQDPHDRQLDVDQQVGQPAPADLLALPGGERVGQQRVGGRPRRRRRRQPALLAQLAERVGAARRLEQVGGDLGVVGEVLRHLPSDLASWAMTGRVAERRDQLLGAGAVAGQHLGGCSA